MSQPWQLAKAHKPRKSSRPILEQLPAVSTTELRISSLYNGKTAIISSLKLPRLAAVKVSAQAVEFHFQSLHRGIQGPVQRFNVKAIHTGFGIRYAFVCSTCGKGRIKLYLHNHSLLCRFCCNGRYASQTLDSKTRPFLEASRIQSFLEKIGLRKQTRERLTRKLGEKVMRAQGCMGTKARNLWE